MEDEVLRALNVLKNADKLDSILFARTDKLEVFLPDITGIFKEGPLEIKLYCQPSASSYRFYEPKEKIDNIISNWRLAKLATTFL